MGRHVAAARRLLADRRVAAALAAALVVAGTGGWVLFGHQPAPETAPETPFDVGEPPAPDGDSYREVARVRFGDDGRTLELVRTYAPGDPAVSLLRWRSESDTEGFTDDDVTAVAYVRDDTAHLRTSYANASTYRERLATVRAEETFVRADDTTRTVYSTDYTESADPLSSAGRVVFALRWLPYERVGTTTYHGREAVRYEPRAGWMPREGGLSTRRVRSADGTVLVDAETRALVYADVEASVVRATRWWGALTGYPVDVRLTYRVETGVDRPEAPPWVAAINGTGDAERNP